MKLKLDENGHVVVQDGKPVYTKDDGTDVAFDAPGTVATISRLNGEAKGHREAKEAAETKLKGFEGITDPAEAIKALETIKNLDAKKLVDAGQVEKVREEAIKATEEKYAPIVKERDSLKGELHSEKIGGSFSRSKFIADKLAIPSDLVEARFGKNFGIEEGKVVAKDSNGNPIFSQSRPGELADFDESLEFLVNAYPQKEAIMKGSGGGGGGASGKGGTTQPGGGKTITRDQFDGLDPRAQAAKMKEGITVVDGGS